MIFWFVCGWLVGVVMGAGGLFALSLAVVAGQSDRLMEGLIEKDDDQSDAPTEGH